VTVRNVIFDLDPSPSRVVVVKFPSRNRAVIPDAALDVYHAGRSKIRPGEFLLARPHKLDWLAGRASEPRRLNCALARVFATVTRTGVGNNDATFIFRNV